MLRPSAPTRRVAVTNRWDRPKGLRGVPKKPTLGPGCWGPSRLEFTDHFCFLFCYLYIVCVCVCVCVSTPGPRVSYRHFNPHFLPTVSPAGGDRVTAWLSPTKLHAVDQDAGTDHPCVPAPSTVDHAVQSPFLFPWWFMILPTNLLCPSSCRSPLVRCCRESADVHKPLVQTSTTDRTPHLTVEPFLSLGN